MGSVFRRWGQKVDEGRARLLVGRLGVVALATGTAAAARFAMTPLIGLRIPLFTFYPAIMVCAAHGGLWSGLLCTALSALLILYFWIPPIGAFVTEDVGNAVALTIFVASGVAIALLHEILRRHRAQLVTLRAEAEDAARNAVAANQAKDEFLGILSHELRTPLTAVVGWANVLRTRTCDAAVQARALEAIERNAVAQVRIVDDLLDVSRILGGKLRLERQPIEVAPVVLAAVEVVRSAAEAKGVTLATIVDPSAGMVQADAVRIQQVVWNLLVNAVKFTRPGGLVDVRLERVTSAVQLTVTDTGEGIPADFLPHVFERFRQVDGSSTRSHGGLGLGLAIVKHLVDAHGGTVAAASAGPGKGAMFTVRLPSHATIRTPVGARDEARPAAASLAGMRVLVVDDDLDALDLIAMILRDRGAKVVVAATAAEGLRTLECQPVDVMVADIDMPGEDGYNLMKRATVLRAARGQHLPALALTACAGVRDAQDAAHAGFEAHVAKPVLANQLIQVVAQLGRRAAAPHVT